jgi:phage host-nuclease inhibitor protein Gam
MASRKVSVLGSNLPVPQDDSEAREAIRELGDANRDMVRIEADLNDKIALLQQEAGALVEPIKDRIMALHEGLRVFAEANRTRLTGGGKVKSYSFSTGTISWRTRPAKVSIRGIQDVIDAIKAAKLGKTFLRIKEEVNKEAMLSTPQSRSLANGLKGVTIGSDGEDFTVEPFETDLQEAG